MRVIHRSTLVLLLGMALAACDRTPMDPALDQTRASAANAVFAPSNSSLPSLFRSATARVERDYGTSVRQHLLADWRRLNQSASNALKTGDRQAAQRMVAAVRAEEIRIVLRVLGTGVVRKSALDVGVSLARLRFELNAAAGEGKDVSRARALAADVASALIRVNRALETGDPAAALDQVTRASDLLDGAAHSLIALRRIPTLESLYAEAMARPAQVRTRDDIQKHVLALQKLNEDTKAALRRGNRERVRTNLDAARQAQIRITLGVLGTAPARSLMGQVDAGIAASRARLERITEPALVERGTRMLKEASDLNSRARSAWSKGDVVTALDLASHASGLINALQHLFPR